MDFVALGNVGSSWIRDQTRVSCVGRQILYHWATRVFIFYYYLLVGSYFILCQDFPNEPCFEGSDYSLNKQFFITILMYIVFILYIINTWIFMVIYLNVRGASETLSHLKLVALITLTSSDNYVSEDVTFQSCCLHIAWRSRGWGVMQMGRPSCSMTTPCSALLRMNSDTRDNGLPKWRSW